jgi:hypothetical protein
MPPSSGNSFGVYRAIDGHIFSAISTFGQTTVGTGACGIVFDTSSGTVSVSGQTRTKRVIIPVGGVNIFETNDGGQTWSSTGAATAFGTSSFSLLCGVINSGGVYYASVINIGVFRYSGFGGSWTNITPSGYTVTNQTLLLVDPSDPTYLSVMGELGIAYGSTSTNANTGTPTWTSTTPTNSNLIPTAPSYDAQYLRYIFGQGSGFFYATCVKIDTNGDTIFSGNQSIWKISGRLAYTGSNTINAVSFARGMEATVAQEAYRPAGATYPLIGPQDIGLMLGGTYTSYPTDYQPRLVEYTCSSIEESPTDGNFVVARITGQGGAPLAAPDGSGYSTDAGMTWTQYSTMPTSQWSANITGSISGSVLTVTAVSSGTLFVGQNIFDTGSGNLNCGYISSLGTGTGGTGTYNLTLAVAVTSRSLTAQADNNSGQIIAADNSHHLIVPAGFSHGTFPVYTANTGVSWSRCSGLPSGNWMFGPWFFQGTNSKPLAVGFGSDVGTVWAAALTAPTTLTIYRSTNYGALFSSVGSITVSINIQALQLLAVPGQPGVLYLCARNAGLWRSVNSGSSWSSITPPDSFIGYASIGVNGTIWLTAKGDATTATSYSLYYSTTNGSSWILHTIRANLPIRQQLDGLGAVRADRTIDNQLYAACGATGFAYFGDITSGPPIFGQTVIMHPSRGRSRH